MPIVLRELAEHKLYVNPKARHVKQSLRPFNMEPHHTIGEEINRLLTVGFIRAIKHPKCLANPVLVQKKNNTWRMCIDYTNLNFACPKEDFVLPRINQIVDSTVGSKSLYFLDAYNGYNQIKNGLHYAIWMLLLHYHDLRSPKHQSHLSAVHARMPYEPSLAAISTSTSMMWSCRETCPPTSPKLSPICRSMCEHKCH
jgi:hypothetical protein